MSTHKRKNNTSKSISKDVTSRKRKAESSSSERASKKRKIGKPVFDWKPYVQILIDIVEKKKITELPSLEDCTTIAMEMTKKYKVANIDGEIVRSKLRSKLFEKIFDGTNNINEENEGPSEEGTDSEYEEDDDCSDDDLGEADLHERNLKNPGSIDKAGYEKFPNFWVLVDSKHSLYFTNRNLKMKALHVNGRQGLDIFFHIEPPTVHQVIELMKKKPATLSWLDISDMNIQNQIKQWKPISWKVGMNAPSVASSFILCFSRKLFLARFSATSVY